jgi:hypothetical protein
VLNFVIQTIIQPRVVGNTVGLSATLSFLSLIIWATILGASGAFLAIPLSLFVKSLFVDVDPEHDWVVPLLSSGSPNDKPAAPPHEAAAEPEPEPEPAKPTEAAANALEPPKPTGAEAP